MAKIKKRWLIFIVILPMMLYLIYYKWHKGTPYKEKNYSPNKEFYFQRYKVFSIDEWTPALSMPGNAGGFYNIHGYIRAYTAGGKIIGEVYTTRMPRAYVFWSLDNLMVMDGVIEEDEKAIVRLPKNSELPW